MMGNNKMCIFWAYFIEVFLAILIVIAFAANGVLDMAIGVVLDHAGKASACMVIALTFSQACVKMTNDLIKGDFEAYLQKVNAEYIYRRTYLHSSVVLFLAIFAFLIFPSIESAPIRIFLLWFTVYAIINMVTLIQSTAMIQRLHSAFAKSSNRNTENTKN